MNIFDKDIIQDYYWILKEIKLELLSKFDDNVLFILRAGNCPPKQTQISLLKLLEKNKVISFDRIQFNEPLAFSFKVNRAVLESAIYGVEFELNPPTNLPIVGTNKPQDILYKLKEGFIALGDKKVRIPIGSKQYLLIRLLLRKKGVADNLAIFDELESGQDVKPPDNYWRKYYDIVRRINEKTNKQFGIDLLEYKDKEVRLLLTK